MRKPTKVTIVLLLLVSLASAASASDVLLDGLNEEKLDVTYYGNDTEFEASYLSKNLSYKKVLVPESLQDDLAKWHVKSKSDSGSLTELQVQYEFDQSTGYSSLDGYKFDSKITFNASGVSTFKTKGGAINVTADAHYEHVILDYTWNDGPNTTITDQDVYSGSEPSIVPFSGGNTYSYYDDSTPSEYKTDVWVEYDNKYDDPHEVTVAVAYPNERSLEIFRANGITYTKVTGSHYDNIKQQIIDNGLSSDLILDNKDDYNIEYYNATVPSDKLQTFEATIDTENGENDNVYMWVLGSVGGGVFTVSNSSEWNAGTFTNTTEQNGVLQLQRGMLTDSFEDGDIDGWNTFGNEVDTGDGSVTVNTSLGKDGSNSAYLETNGDNDNDFTKVEYTGINLTGEYPVNLSTWYRHGSITESNTGGFRVWNSTSNVADIWFSGGGIEFRCDGCSWSGDGSPSSNTWYYLSMQFDSNGQVKFWAQDTNRNNVVSPKTKTAGNSDNMDAIDRVRATTRDNGDKHDDAHIDLASTGFAEYTQGRYTSELINNTEKATWTDVWVNVTDLPSGSDLDLTFRPKDNSTGTVQDQQVIDLSEGAANYTLDTVDTADADFLINGTSPNSSVTWEVGDVKTYYSFNGPPVFNSKSYFRSFNSFGSKSFCGRNDAETSSGSTAISRSIDVDDHTKQHTLVVQRVKNTNTYDMKINGNSVGSGDSTTGSGCNNNNWVVETYDVQASYLGSNSQTVTIDPSGTDDNYVAYVGLREQTKDPLLHENWEYVAEANVTDPDGDSVTVKIGSENKSKDLKLDEGDKYFEIGSASSQSYINNTWNATDNKVFTTSEQSIDIDYQVPTVTNIWNFTDDLVIDHFETDDTAYFYSNVSDETGLNTVSCYVDNKSQTTSNTNDKYDCSYTASSAGVHTYKFNATDQVQHLNETHQKFNVTDVTASFSNQNYGTPYKLGTDNQTENTLIEENAIFKFNHDITANGTANASTLVNKSYSITKIKEWSVDTPNISFNENRNNDTFTYEIYTETNSSDGSLVQKTHNVDVSVKAENITNYWQNAANDDGKRYYRIDTNFSYQPDLYADIEFHYRKTYDIHEKHGELWECTNPSDTERYTCDGNWNQIASTEDGSNDNNEYLNQKVSLSDHLYFTDIVDGAQAGGGDGGGGGGGGGGVVVGGDSSDTVEEDKSLEDQFGRLEGLFLKPLVEGYPYINLLSLGLLTSILILLGLALSPEEYEENVPWQ